MDATFEEANSSFFEEFMKCISTEDTTTNEEKTVVFVGPEKTKVSKNKISILSDEGIAMVGYKVGNLVEWPAKKGDLKLEILKVEEVA